MRHPLRNGDRVHYMNAPKDRGTIIDGGTSVRWDDGQVDDIDRKRWTLSHHHCTVHKASWECSDECKGRRVGMVRRKPTARCAVTKDSHVPPACDVVAGTCRACQDEMRTP